MDDQIVTAMLRQFENAMIPVSEGRAIPKPRRQPKQSLAMHAMATRALIEALRKRLVQADFQSYRAVSLALAIGLNYQAVESRAVSGVGGKMRSGKFDPDREAVMRHFIELTTVKGLKPTAARKLIAEATGRPYSQVTNWTK